VTEYRETKEDREDEARRMQYNAGLSTARSILLLADTPPSFLLRRIMTAAEDTIKNLEKSIEQLDERVQARRDAFQSDRAKLQRAFRALRKAGVAASMSEPPYESVKPSSKAITEAAKNEDPHVIIHSDRVKHAFDRSTFWSRGYGTDPTDTLQRDLYVNFGPDVAAGQRAFDALKSEGLGVEWDGTFSNSVTIKAKERAA
jgi:hypothetical protein